MEGELKAVAKANIVRPQDTMMHNEEMPTDSCRIVIIRVLAGFEELYPPFQPPEADAHYNLADCKGWIMLWPKSQIELHRKERTTPSPAAAHGMNSTTGPSPLGNPGPSHIEQQMEETPENNDYGEGIPQQNQYMDMEPQQNHMDMEQ